MGNLTTSSHVFQLKMTPQWSSSLATSRPGTGDKDKLIYLYSCFATYHRHMDTRIVDDALEFISDITQNVH